MDGKRLVNRGHMRDSGEPSRLRGHPMRAAGMGMDDLDFIGPDEGSHAPGIDELPGIALR